MIGDETDSNNLWENRKGRLVRSIRDNSVDILGLNECSSDIQSYLGTEMSDIYNFRFFSPYSQDGAGDKAQGLAYKKDWTLSDWHFFWLSNDDPDVMVVNDTGDKGNFKRGGCCGVLTKEGKSIFVMVTHGALSSSTRVQYSGVYQQMEQRFNTAGLPSFLIGDMNAEPDASESATYRSYWTDTYTALASIRREGPYATFNNFNLSLNLYTGSTHRIDYIYYRGGVTPLYYVCNDTRYDGYYASDHLPIYSDMRLD